MIYLNSIFISAANSPMNTTAKMVKVVMTDVVGMSLTAARVGRSPSIVQGWRPTSATTQPASEHIHTTGIERIAMI